MSDETVGNGCAALVKAEDVVDMFGGQKTEVPIGAQLPTITVNKDLQKFVFPGGALVDEFEGHILYWHNANQFYSKKFGGGEQFPPDCTSSNGMSPDGGENRFSIFGSKVDSEELVGWLAARKAPEDVIDSAPTGDLFQAWMNRYANGGGVIDDEMFVRIIVDQCSMCPANKYETADNGTSKACQNSIWLYIIPDGYRLPVFMKAGPASLGNKGSLVPFLTNAQNVGLAGKYQTIRTKFTLQEKKFSSGMSASAICCKVVKVLQQGEIALIELGRLYQVFIGRYLKRISEAVAADKTE